MKTVSGVASSFCLCVCVYDINFIFMCSTSVCLFVSVHFVVNEMYLQYSI